MADWLRSLWRSSHLPPDHRRGHSYHDMYIGGNARVHNGDIVYHAASSQNQDIIHWLQPPDSTVEHIEARNKHESGTGRWFIKSAEYKDWLQGQERALWLHGKAGCGKTILCSAAIHDVEAYTIRNQDCAMAYFYFSFANQKKQDYFALVLSLIAQLVRDRDPSKELLTAFRGNQRSVHILEPILVQLLNQKRWTYILIDALDECSEDDDRRQGVLEGLRRLVSLSSKIKLLGTSRDLVDIADFMKKWPIVSVAVSNARVNTDIQLYLTMEMKRDRRLEQLPKKTKDEILKSFSAKADGMFRWANCQLGELKRLKIHRPENITKALHDLPATLDITYERLLGSIDEVHRKDAKTALTWLVFAQRPLRLEELAEACIIDLDETPRVDQQSRSALYGIVEVLSSLVEVTSGERYGEHAAAEDPQSFIKLAHFTVKEYLTSDRIRMLDVEYFGLKETCSHELLLRSCVAYLLYLPEITTTEPPENDVKKTAAPLTSYAATFWDEHLLQAKPETPEQMERCGHLQLLQKTPARALWLARRVEESWRDIDTQPLYWASLFGLGETVRYLCRSLSADINHTAGHYGNALQAASARGHTEVVRILLQEGANANIEGGEWGTPLKAACRKGHLEIISLLIAAGADVDAVGGKYGAAIHTAAAGMHIASMKILIDAGADVNITGGAFYSPLLEAVRRHDRRGAAFLLKNGAEIEGVNDLAQLKFVQATLEEMAEEIRDRAEELLEQIGVQRQALIERTSVRRRTLPGHHSVQDTFEAERRGQPMTLSPESIRLLSNSGGRSAIAGESISADDSDESEDYTSADERT